MNLQSGWDLVSNDVETNPQERDEEDFYMLLLSLFSIWLQFVSAQLIPHKAAKHLAHSVSVFIFRMYSSASLPNMASRWLFEVSDPTVSKQWEEMTPLDKREASILRLLWD